MFTVVAVVCTELVYFYVVVAVGKGSALGDPGTVTFTE